MFRYQGEMSSFSNGNNKMKSENNKFLIENQMWKKVQIRGILIKQVINRCKYRTVHP